MGIYDYGVIGKQSEIFPEENESISCFPGNEVNFLIAADLESSAEAGQEEFAVLVGFGKSDINLNQLNIVHFQSFNTTLELQNYTDNYNELCTLRLVKAKNNSSVLKNLTNIEVIRLAPNTIPTYAKFSGFPPGLYRIQRKVDGRIIDDLVKDIKNITK